MRILTRIAPFLLAGATIFAQGVPQNPAYVLGADSQVKPGVPKGKVIKFTYDTSRILPGTSRAVSVYVPAQYDGSKPACVMVYQDGAGYVSETGGSRATIVMDNLIADGSMPVTIGIFVDPGITPGLTADQMARYHRSLEYDGLGDRYARFLIEDLIPEAEKQANVKISVNADDRGLIGGSSGGIAAFNAAWERPDSFHRVISYIGSFTNLRGADGLADLVRKVEPKPLRIFMQDGSNDQSIYSGSWFIANQQLYASLEYSGYDAKFVIGTEGHSGRHGGAILPEALRWLWREYPKPVVASKGGPGSRHYVTDFLDPASDWEVVGQGYGSAGAAAVDKSGVLYFADSKAERIYRLGADGRPEVFKDNAASTGLMFGPDGRLYAAQPAKRRIVSWDGGGAELVVAQAVDAHHLAVTSKGLIYFTDPAARRVWLLDTDKPNRREGRAAKHQRRSHPRGGPKASVVRLSPQKKKRVVFQSTAENSIGYPAGIQLSPDEHLVNVTDRDSRWVWSMQIGPDNGLRYPLAYHHLESPDDTQVTEAAGIAIDTTGHLFVATKLGIQICDQPGRVVGVVRKPQPGSVVGRALGAVVFGGEGLHTLYVTAGDKVYGRRMRRTGTLPWQPVKLPRPQL